MKISYKISLVASAVVLMVFVLLSAVQYKLTSDNIYKKLEANIDETSVVLDHQISNWLNGKVSIINNLADIISKESSPNVLQSIIESKEGASAFQLMFYIDDATGRFLMNQDLGIPEDVDTRDRFWYKLAKRNSRAVMTEAYVDETAELPMITVVSQVSDLTKMATKGVIGGDISTQVVSDALNQINFDGSGYVFLASATGKIIIHPDQSLYDKNLNTLFQIPIDIANTTALQQAVLVDGTDVLVKMKNMTGAKGSEWLLGIVVEKDKILAETKTLATNAIIGTMLSVLLCSVLLYLFMNKLVINPIQSLTEAANNLSRGEMDTKISGLHRSDEIGELSKSIQRMQKSLSISLSRLRKKKGVGNGKW